MGIRVLIADDHKIVLEGLRGLLGLEPDIEVVGDASNGRDVVELARQLRPDVVVIDVTMPGLNGVTATRQILKHVEETEVVALSVHTSDQVASDMIRAGASGYVVKNASIEEVVHAIRAVADGRTYYSSSITAAPKDTVHRSTGRESKALGALSSRECEVLQLVAEGKSSKQIARTLHVTTKTIGWHRQSIMDKVGIHSVAELTKYSVRKGMTPLYC